MAPVGENVSIKPTETKKRGRHEYTLSSPQKRVVTDEEPLLAITSVIDRRDDDMHGTPRILQMVDEIPALRSELLHASVDETLAAYREKYPEQEFEIGKKCQIYIQCGKRSLKACVHGEPKCFCAVCKVAVTIAAGGPAAEKMRPIHNPKLEDMERDFATRKFMLVNGKVMQAENERLRFVCGHGNQHCRCMFCGGSDLCQKHWTARGRCYRCNLALRCIYHPNHNRYVCPLCPGIGWCADHKTQKSQCFRCDPTKGCKTCGIRKRYRDGYCMKHHPLYVPTKGQSSKLSCEVIDRLAKELNVPFQHVHYGEGVIEPTGEEYSLEKYPKKKGVDGAFMWEGKLALFEFQGDYWHGHPSRHGKGETRIKNGRVTTMEEIFNDTERIMRNVIERTGMRLFYVWEFDYDMLADDALVWSIVREFTGTLK